MQPIIRGIQAVGAVDLRYVYNGPKGELTVPTDLIKIPTDRTGGYVKKINTAGGLSIAGFRLDGEFLRANPQLASSFTVPILGGGGVSFTNNNRTGQVTFNCTRVSSPNAGNAEDALRMYNSPTGGVGVTDGSSGESTAVYDLVLIAQIQQAQVGGDASGALISVQFTFNNIETTINFEGCTVASVDPVGLTGNDATNYNVVFNYLNWKVQFGTPPDADTGETIAQPWLVTGTKVPKNEAGITVS